MHKGEVSVTRRLLSIVASGALVATLLALGTGTVAAKSINACFVKNGSTSYGPGTGSNLQTAINQAASGATLTIRGRCVGNFTIQAPKVLTLVGVRGHGFRVAAIDAGGSGTALAINGDFAGGTLATDVTLIDLLVTGGGTGIFNFHGIVTLDGSTRVSGNTARGIAQSTGNLTLNDQSTVSGNSATVGGAGIYTFRGTVTLNDAASVTGNVSGGSGGGIALDFGSVRLAGSSSVTGNTAGVDGGGIGHYFGAAATAGNTIEACGTWAGAISPNTPNDAPTPTVVAC